MKMPLSSGPHRSWLTALPTLLALLIATASGSPVHAQACTWKTCPNIVFIMFDDLGLPNLTPYPQSPVGDTPVMSTPTIQALADVGVRFDQYYVAPVCSPTRVSLLTGQYQQGFNVRKQLRFYETWRGIPGDVTTLPEMLKTRGYQTGHFGKWHVGFNKPEFRPQAMGFDTMWMLSEHDTESGLKHCDPWAYTSDSSGRAPFEGKTTELLFNRAETFIGAIDQADQCAEKGAPDPCFEEDEPPFFANIWLWAPHQPYRDRNMNSCTIPDPYLSTCAALNPTDNRNKFFCALMAETDARIDAFMTIVKRLPGNTIVIVASDNGNLNDADHSNQNYPLRGDKGNLFEGGIRVPMIAWKKTDLVAPTGARTYEEPVASFELFPTLAEIAGANLADFVFDGQSFAPAILETSDPPRNADFVFENGLSNTNIDGIGGYNADRRWLDYAVRRRDSSGNDWKLLFQHFIDTAPNPDVITDETYLFRLDNLTGNHEEDLDDLSVGNAAKIASLKQDYLDWRRRETLLPFTVDSLVNVSAGNIEAQGRDVFFAGPGLVEMADNTLYDFHDGDFGFSAWIRPEVPSGSDNDRIIAHRPGSWVLTWNRTTAKVKLVIQEYGSVDEVTLESTSTAPANTWTPVSFSLFGWRAPNEEASIRLYVGADHTGTSFISEDSGIHGVEIDPPNTVQIGGGYAGGTTVDEDSSFLGKMRDIEMVVASWLPEEVGRYASAQMRYEEFEGTTAGWETSVVDSGATLTTHASAGMTLDKGLQAFVPAGTKAYLSESDLDDDSVGDSETRFRASFQFDPDGLNLPINTQLRIFAGRQTSPATNPVTIDLRQTATGYQVQGRVLLDTVSPLTYVTTAWYPVSGQTHIDFEWRAADPGFDEGSFSLSLNYQLMETLKKIDNGTRVINRVTLGAITPTPASVSSTLWIDHFESYR